MKYLCAFSNYKHPMSDEHVLKHFVQIFDILKVILFI